MVPTVSFARAHRAQMAAFAAASGPVYFHGGIDGVGVTSGAPKVYVVFWGSQWGSEGKNSAGFKTFSGDKQGMAPVIQEFFAGLGSEAEGERWSGVIGEYCEGIPAGTTGCPVNAPHVGLPSGGALAGVWEDNSREAPAKASAHEIAAEAVRAARHFHNTSAAANRDVQYDIVSPPGTRPDAWSFEGESGFCAWHDYTADKTLEGGGAVPTPWGSPVAFTNMPYIPEAGKSCGEGAVNPGPLDGVTIVGGHEYAETLTDQFPLGGWADPQENEIADKCAWITSGAGAMRDIKLSTGSFPVQSLWSNELGEGAGGCEISPSSTRSKETFSLAFTSEPSSASPGAPFEVAVAVENQYGEVQTGGERSSDSIKLSIASGPQQTFNSCTENPVNAVEGVAHFTCTLNTTGAYTLSASDLSDPSAGPPPPLEVEVTAPSEAFSLAFASESTSASPGAPFEVAVAVHSHNGKVQSGGERSSDSIKLSIASGPQQSFNSCAENPVNAVEGVAHFTCTLNAPGAYTLSASDLSDPSAGTPPPLEVEVSGLPKAAAGWEVHMFADGFYNVPHFAAPFYLGPIGIVSDAANNLYIGDAPNGLVYKLGAAGGAAEIGDQLTSSAIGYWPLGLSFGKEGALYAVINGEERIVQINPATGTVERVVTEDIEDPLGIATDPVSGDLLVTSDGEQAGVWRIHEPASKSPTVSLYAGGMEAPDGIAAGPDGTFYVEDNGTVYSVAGTAAPSPGTATKIGFVSGADGVGVGANPFDPSAPSYIVVNSNFGELVKVPLGAGEAEPVPIFTGGTRGDFVTVAPNGCLYATQSNSVLRVSASGGACPFAPITPFQPPATEPAPPGPVSETKADFKATIDPHGAATTFHFQYGTTTGYGSETAESEAGSANEPITVSQEVSGLSPGTTYHYRVVAHNEAGTIYGPDGSLTTALPPSHPPAPPPPPPSQPLSAALAPPKEIQAPSISGLAQVGKTLSCSAGRWEGATKVATSWLRDERTAVGQGATYRVQAADAGHSLICVAHAEGPGGSASAASAAVMVHARARTFRIRLRARRVKISRLAAHGVEVEVGVPQRCRVFLRLIAVRVTHGRPIVKLLAARHLAFSKAGSRRVRLRVPRRRLARLGHGYLLRITADALSGSEHSQPASLTLGR